MRIILHCDLNNFYASVESVLDPLLKNKYVAVCGDPKMRHGIVLAKNTKAKGCGVRTGDVVWEAMIKCPQLICVKPHYDKYLEYSQIVRKIYYRYTDQVETYGLDECWLDVTDSASIMGNGYNIAENIRKTVKKETGLTVSIGVSFNKIFAKLGSDIKKPDAVTVINENNFRRYIWTLPVENLLMVGGSSMYILDKINIHTIGDLAAIDDFVIKKKFGKNGLMLKKYAMGLDDAIVAKANSIRDIKSVGQGSTPLEDMKDYKSAEALIMFLSELIASRLRKYKFMGASAQIALRYNDLSGIVRQKIMKYSSYIAGDIFTEFCMLLRENWNPEYDMPLRTISVAIGHLSEIRNGIQLNWEDIKGRGFQKINTIYDNNKNNKLQSTVDGIREKYGYGILSRGNTIGNNIIYEMEKPSDDILPFRNEGIKIGIEN